MRMELMSVATESSAREPRNLPAHSPPTIRPPTYPVTREQKAWGFVPFCHFCPYVPSVTLPLFRASAPHCDKGDS